LETATRDAINELFLDLKTTITWRSNDITLWDKMGYALPFCGPRTLAGAMIPLQNLTESTAVNSGGFGWNRKIGLGITSATSPLVTVPYANNTNGQNDCSASIKVTEAAATSGCWLNCNNTGARREFQKGASNDEACSNNTAAGTIGTGTRAVAGWRGMTRIASGSYDARTNGVGTTITAASTGLAASTFFLFRRSGGAQQLGINNRLNFMQLGADLDLAALEAVVDTYVAAIAAAF
jgi:hypothetical protein